MAGDQACTYSEANEAAASPEKPKNKAVQLKLRWLFLQISVSSLTEKVDPPQ